ncbi:MAG: shikimate kinase [Halobacteriales archaeon]|nr:shikimate kinase [Halobacteriales archaeon]
MTGHGKARCHGAITVVNAIATGKGAAVGIGLQTEAEVELKPSGHLVVDIQSEEREPTALVRASVQRAFAAGNCAELGAYVATRSAIPAARGLKSSSAAANAVILAALEAAGRLDGIGDQELIRLGVEAAVTASVTITGAFDDASACFLGGLCLTDNGRRELLQRTEVDERLVAVLHVPPERTPKSSLGKVEWAKVAPQAEQAFELAMKGDWLQALRINGAAYAGLLGVSQEPARIALEAGALTAGLSGTGPSTAAVCQPEDAKRVAKALGKLGTGIVLQANLTNRQAEVVRRSP